MCWISHGYFGGCCSLLFILMICCWQLFLVVELVLLTLLSGVNHKWSFWNFAMSSDITCLKYYWQSSYRLCYNRQRVVCCKLFFFIISSIVINDPKLEHLMHPWQILFFVIAKFIQKKPLEMFTGKHIYGLCCSLLVSERDNLVSGTMFIIDNRLSDCIVSCLHALQANHTL